MVCQRRHLRKGNRRSLDRLSGRMGAFPGRGPAALGISVARFTAGRGESAGRLGARTRSAAPRAPLSRAVLNARSNALAHALLAQGVARQEPVGVLTGRSIALPETVLAIWKAGGCYLPLVMDLPADRLAFMARDAGIRVLVVLDGHRLPASLAETGCQIFRPESLSEAFLRSHVQPPEIGHGVGGSDLACIIYTSGSTGVPKGVMLHHQGLINLGVAMDATLDIR